MYLEWYDIIALILAVPGLFFLHIALIWGVGFSYEVFKSIPKGEVDGLSFVGGFLGFLLTMFILATFGISSLIFGLKGILYAISFFSIFFVYSRKKGVI